MKASKKIAKKIVAFQVQDESVSEPLKEPIISGLMDDDSMVCLCERVTAGEIRGLIKKGITDLNQIKAISRAGMGPCGSKTCDNLIRQIMREQGIPPNKVIENVRRPVFVEVPLGNFAVGKGGCDE